MYFDHARSRELDLRTQSQVIENRMLWAQVSKVEKLEAELRKASAQLSYPLNTEALAR